MAKRKEAHAPELIARYERLISTQPDVQRKGAANPYTSMNGNMFSFLTKEGGLALRLSDEERAAFLKKHPGSEVYSYDTLMKHYVLVPAKIMANTRSLNALFKKSCAHARELKPKPTTRKKK